PPVPPEPVSVPPEPVSVPPGPVPPRPVELAFAPAPPVPPEELAPPRASEPFPPSPALPPTLPPADPLSPLRNLLVHPTASMKITMHPTTRLTSVEYHAGLEADKRQPLAPSRIDDCSI